MAEADANMVSKSAAPGAAEEAKAGSSSNSGEESDSSSCSSSDSSSSSSLSLLHSKKRRSEPSRRSHSSGRYFMDHLPRAVRNRVQALRNIQTECDKVDTLFLKAIHELEKKYAVLNKPLYDQRCKIVNAEYEPTREECEWNSEDEEFSSDEEVQEESPAEMPALEGEEDKPKEQPEVKAEEKEAPKENPEKEKAEPKEIPEAKPEVKEEPKEAPQAKAEEKEQPKPREARDARRESSRRAPELRLKERASRKRAHKRKSRREEPKGIPNYWLTVLRNVEKLGTKIQKYDEPILKYLSDVCLKFSKPGQPISYTFEFHFLPNPYFRNEVLTKSYMITSKPDHNDPFFSCGWEIEDCKGCKIDWRRGKDVTVTTTYSRTTATGEIEIKPRIVPNASFFNFFSPPEIPKIGKLEPREDAILDEDFEIGQILHDNVILKSVYYYTGEINGSYYRNRRYRK